MAADGILSQEELDELLGEIGSNKQPEAAKKPVDAPTNVADGVQKSTHAATARPALGTKRPVEETLSTEQKRKRFVEALFETTFGEDWREKFDKMLSPDELESLIKKICSSRNIQSFADLHDSQLTPTKNELTSLTHEFFGYIGEFFGWTAALFRDSENQLIQWGERAIPDADQCEKFLAAAIPSFREVYKKNLESFYKEEIQHTAKKIFKNYPENFGANDSISAEKLEQLIYGQIETDLIRADEISVRDALITCVAQIHVFKLIRAGYTPDKAVQLAADEVFALLNPPENDQYDLHAEVVDLTLAGLEPLRGSLSSESRDEEATTAQEAARLLKQKEELIAEASALIERTTTINKSKEYVISAKNYLSPGNTIDELVLYTINTLEGLINTELRRDPKWPRYTQRVEELGNTIINLWHELNPDQKSPEYEARIDMSLREVGEHLQMMDSLLTVMGKMLTDLSAVRNPDQTDTDLKDAIYNCIHEQDDLFMARCNNELIKKKIPADDYPAIERVARRLLLQRLPPRKAPVPTAVPVQAPAQEPEAQVMMQPAGQTDAPVAVKSADADAETQLQPKKKRTNLKLALGLAAAIAAGSAGALIATRDNGDAEATDAAVAGDAVAADASVTPDAAPPMPPTTLNAENNPGYRIEVFGAKVNQNRGLEFANTNTSGIAGDTMVDIEFSRPFLTRDGRAAYQNPRTGELMVSLEPVAFKGEKAAHQMLTLVRAEGKISLPITDQEDMPNIHAPQFKITFGKDAAGKTIFRNIEPITAEGPLDPGQHCERLPVQRGEILSFKCADGKEVSVRGGDLDTTSTDPQIATGIYYKY